VTGQIELNWPPACLTPNAKRRKHWSAYRGPSSKYRADCMWLTRAWLTANGGPSLVGKGLTIQSITFYPPDNRRRDDDGMIGAFKAGRDGVADALGVDDHSFRPTYNFGEPVKGGKIVVTIG